MCLKYFSMQDFTRVDRTACVALSNERYSSERFELEAETERLDAFVALPVAAEDRDWAPEALEERMLPLL